MKQMCLYKQWNPGARDRAQRLGVVTAFAMDTDLIL